MKRLVEKYVQVLQYKGEYVYDSRHSWERFFERGLEQLRPNTYEKICNEFNLPEKSIEGNTDFEKKIGLIERKYSDQKKNSYNLYVWMLKKGIDEIITKYKKTPGFYIIESHKFKMAIQLELREDRQQRGKYIFVTATSLNQRTLKFFKQNDKKVFIEQFKNETKKVRLTEGTTFNNIAIHFFNKPTGMEYDMEGYDIFVEYPGEVNKTFEIVKI